MRPNRLCCVLSTAALALCVALSSAETTEAKEVSSHSTAADSATLCVEFVEQPVAYGGVEMRWSRVLGFLLSLLLLQQVPSQDTKLPDLEVSEPKSTKPVPSRLSPYYDRRERAASNLTFEWQLQKSRVVSRAYLLERLERLAAMSRTEDGATSELTIPEASELNTELAGLQGTYRIERTPDITRIYMREERGGFSLTGGLVKPEKLFEQSVIYLGKTGEVVISYLGVDSLVYVAFAGEGGLGLPEPFLFARDGTLVFLGGVSPLRLFGAAPEDWRLVEVNENSWVFEFHPDKEKRKEMAELESFVRARVRLNRAYDDAPQQLEIFRKDGDYEVWIAEDYKTVNGCWMPSRVVRELSTSQGRVQVVFELVATTPSAPIQIDIPEGAPVHDWRLLGRAVWRGVLDESRKIETQWSAELLRDIWRQIQRESGSASQREEQK